MPLAAQLKFAIRLQSVGFFTVFFLALTMAASTVKRDVDPISGPLMEEMSIYAVKTQVKELLQEYLRRVLLEKPDDPIEFLINNIKKNPYTPPAPQEEIDLRTEEEKSKYYDLRRDETKMDLLKEIFDRFDPKGTGIIARAKVLVAFKNDKSLLLEKFPKHVTELPKALERMDCGNKQGNISWKLFSEGLMICLAGKTKIVPTLCHIFHPKYTTHIPLPPP
jgi:hypothetical protein